VPQSSTPPALLGIPANLPLPVSSYRHSHYQKPHQDSALPEVAFPQEQSQNLQQIVDDNAAIESKDNDAETWMKSVTEDIMKFVESGPVGNIDITIYKLEALKDLLKTDQFDELIQSANQTKDFYEKKKQEDAEDEFDDFFVDEYPPHHYGEDGEVIID
jgi:hypothetical protein